MILLVHSPVVKPSEPPPGIAKLSGVLKHFGIEVKILDLNLEGLLYLLKSPLKPSDTWTKRASRNFSSNLESLKTFKTYKSLDHYKRAVKDLNRLLEVTPSSKDIRLSLTNYKNLNLSPVKSKDLIRVAEQPDANPFFPYLSERLLKVIKTEQPSLVGFSLNYLSQALCTFALIGSVKRECPGIKVILGGGLITSWMKKPGWKNPLKGLVDHCVAGPGEYQLLPLMGINCFEKTYCLPDYTAFPFGEYCSPGPILPYSSSSGCYWNKCSFCPEKAEGNSYTSVPVDETMHTLYALTKKIQPVLVHLLDNALSPELLKAIAGHPLGTPWYGFTRITSHLTDFDFCRVLKQAGCVMLKLGLESGDQGVLDSLHKGIRLEEASRVLKSLKQAGIATYVYLLFGTPSETIVKAKRTLDFIVKHSAYIDFLNLAIFNLTIYGSETEKVETKNFYEGDLSLYTDFFHPHGWNRIAVREFLDKEFTRHPAIGSIVRKEPPFFTSNHAPFFVIKSQHPGDSTFPLP